MARAGLWVVVLALVPGPACHGCGKPDVVRRDAGVDAGASLDGAGLDAAPSEAGPDASPADAADGADTDASADAGSSDAYVPDAAVDSGRCTCESGWCAVCHGRWTDLRFDRDHCFACGNRCPRGCACDECGCGGDFTDCGGCCTHTQSDDRNCGGCGRVCPPGELCTSGICYAPR